MGYDDYSDLKLAGAATAGPIWAEFMKRAVRLPQYSNTTDFTPPSGVVTVSLDKATNLLATPSCPDDYNSVFIEGSEPQETCDRADQRNVFQKILGIPAPAPPAVNQPPRAVPPNQPRQATRVEVTTQPGAAPTNPPPAPEKRKGIWGKVVGIFNGDSKDTNPDSGGENSNSR